MRRNIRVWDSVRHAQAIGLARRIFSAAMPRTRHRACDEQKGDRKGMDYGGFGHSFAPNGASFEIENL